ncbi:hypothetical protein BJY01DRAFT_252760 [Aspergillus pseudoustus]|uniref:Uncharacterized protein n=1 Tax=Aspergillus pseudoustus TaxID=1810923 RepID=A0ABR4J5L0_9EURO
MRFLLFTSSLALVATVASQADSVRICPPLTFHLPYPPLPCPVVNGKPIQLAIQGPDNNKHTVNCWGKALHPELRYVKDAIALFRSAIDNVNHNFPAAIRAEKHSCTETYCVHKTSVRFCNDGDQPRTMPLQNIMDSTITISKDCVSDYEGKKVAGGVVDHSDKWSVVVQKDDKC